MDGVGGKKRQTGKVGRKEANGAKRMELVKCA